MKKLIFALPLLTLPLTAMAQDKPTQAPQKTINGIAEGITQNICEGGMKKAALGIYTCYNNTAKTNPSIKNCIIADTFIYLELNQLNKQAEAMGDPKPFDIPYFSDEQYSKRMDIYFNLPQYKQYTEKQKVNYFIRSKKALKEEIIKLQKNNYCEKK